MSGKAFDEGTCPALFLNGSSFISPTVKPDFFEILFGFLIQLHYKSI